MMRFVASDSNGHVLHRYRVGFSRLSIAAVVVLGMTGVGVATSLSPAGATTDSLFNSSTPGYVPSAAVVPVGICMVTITAAGGPGGVGESDPGGEGASVTATVSVVPGEVLGAEVAGPGVAWNAGVSPDTGGIGGGGGGNGPWGGGGGGASAVSTANTALVVAGGGGGGANGGLGGNAGTLGVAGGGTGGGGGSVSGAGGAGIFESGGGGGVLTGGAGAGTGGNGGAGNGNVGGGGGGASSGTNGGAGGVGGSNGQSGVAGTGSASGGVGDTSGGNGGSTASEGGGGGGGIGFGGGGGGYGLDAGGGAGYGGGAGGYGPDGPTTSGGGGSSFAIASATNTSSALNALADGQVRISYDPVADACPYFIVSAPTTATSGTPFSVTVTAFTGLHASDAGYTGHVAFTSSDSTSTLPSASTLTDGTGTFSVTLHTTGAQTITATDSVSSGMTGTSSGIVVSPKVTTTTTTTTTTPPAIPSQLELQASTGAVSGRTVTAELSCVGGVACSGIVEITVARMHHRGSSVFYTHPVLAKASVSLSAGSQSNVDLTVTKLGRPILERRVLFHRFRTTMLIRGSAGRDVQRLYLPH